MPRLSVPLINRFHSFPGQRHGEEAVLFVRHHWIFDLAILVRCVFWMIVPVLFLLVIDLLRFNPSERARLLLVIILCWVEISVLLTHYIHWLKTYLDYDVVSTERVVDVEQIDLFRVNVSETSLEEIQDVRSSVPGFLGSVLGFGDLTIQTAAEKGEFRMKNVPRAMEIRPLILDLAESYRRRLQSGAMETMMANAMEEGAPPPPAT